MKILAKYFGGLRDPGKRGEIKGFLADRANRSANVFSPRLKRLVEGGLEWCPWQTSPADPGRSPQPISGAGQPPMIPHWARFPSDPSPSHIEEVAEPFHQPIRSGHPVVESPVIPVGGDVLLNLSGCRRSPVSPSFSGC